jgi:hypothetical protein
MPTPLIENLDQIFDPTRSRLVSDSGSTRALEKIYRDIEAKVSDGGEFTLRQARTAHRILNMELITDGS